MAHFVKLMKFWWIAVIWAVLIVIVYYLLTRPPLRVTCASFPNQSKAQDKFESNPIEYKALDHNHNGIACEGNK